MIEMWYIKELQFGCYKFSLSAPLLQLSTHSSHLLRSPIRVEKEGTVTLSSEAVRHWLETYAADDKIVKTGAIIMLISQLSNK